MQFIGVKGSAGNFLVQHTTAHLSGWGKAVFTAVRITLVCQNLWVYMVASQACSCNCDTTVYNVLEQHLQIIFLSSLQ